MDKRIYRRPTVKIIDLKTKESVLTTCRSSQQFNAIGPCNSLSSADCENKDMIAADRKCLQKTEPAS